MKEAFHIGQLVRIARSAANDGDYRTYCIVCLVVSEDDDTPVYRVEFHVVRRPDDVDP